MDAASRTGKPCEVGCGSKGAVQAVGATRGWCRRRAWADNWVAPHGL